MEYYKLLQLDREPFSNSPDPDYFYRSRQHHACLQKLELALRLKRGLNVVIGDVGTGKTTLCRQLLRAFSNDPDFEAHLILDPSFSTSHEFTKHIFELICKPRPAADPSDLEMKEYIKQSLFAKGVDRGKTLVLIIDEGQNITTACVEILRELLNYETNTFKLLQIVIFAQLEFEAVLSARANFTDRINMLHYLQPMNFKDTCQMVQHRLKLASATARPKRLFTFPAMWAIYLASKGYPRKIIHLCHQSILALIIQNRTLAGWSLIRSCQKRIGPSVRSARRPLIYGSMAVIGMLLIIGYAPEFVPREPENTYRQTFILPPSGAILPAPKKPAAKADARLTSPQPDLPQPADGPAPPPRLALPATSQIPVPEREAAEIGFSGLADVQDAKEDQPRQAPSPASPVIKPPEILGRLVVKPGDTMVDLVQAVYGTHRNRHLRAVMEANAHIPNPNAIDIGQTISFPALRSKSKTGNCPCWWVILDQQPSLQTAMGRYLELLPLARRPLQFIPSWSPQSGTRFQIGLKGFFSSHADALDAARALPQEIVAGSDIVSAWPPVTIFYSNPAAGGIQHNQTTQ